MSLTDSANPQSQNQKWTYLQLPVAIGNFDYKTQNQVVINFEKAIPKTIAARKAKILLFLKTAHESNAEFWTRTRVDDQNDELIHWTYGHRYPQQAVSYNSETHPANQLSFNEIFHHWLFALIFTKRQYCRINFYKSTQGSLEGNLFTLIYKFTILLFSLQFKRFLSQYYNMLADLKIVEDKLFLPEALEEFHQKYPVHELIKQLNKASKKDTRQLIRRYLSKLSASNHYRDFLFACLTEQNQRRKEFIKYVSSQHSEEFFVLLQQKRYDVLALIQNYQTTVPVLLKMIGFQFGLKLVKLFKELYEIDSEKYECLFNPQILRGLEEGLGFSEGEAEPLEGIDTVAQMRYLEIVVNIAIIGGKCYNFVENLLNRALNLYNTEDVLLKMALVQIISVLGDGAETAKLLRQHKVWKFIQKDASDVDQQFYVRKFLLLLLVDLVAQGHYTISPKMSKDIQTFLRLNLTSNGEFLEAAVDLIGHLFRSVAGCQLVVQDKEVFNRYIRLSLLTVDSIKRPFYESLRQLTHLSAGEDAKKSPKYRLVIYILNCIGNPENVQSFNSTTLQNTYIDPFNKWFISRLQLPFEQVEIVLVDIFSNLLGYYQVAESLFQLQDTTKYLLKPLPGNDSSKVLRGKKTQLINAIIRNGEEEWKGLELSEYSRNLEKLIKNRKQEVMYALDIV